MKILTSAKGTLTFCGISIGSSAAAVMESAQVVMRPSAGFSNEWRQDLLRSDCDCAEMRSLNGFGSLLK